MIFRLIYATRFILLLNMFCFMIVWSYRQQKLKRPIMDFSEPSKLIITFIFAIPGIFWVIFDSITRVGSAKDDATVVITEEHQTNYHHSIIVPSLVALIVSILTFSGYYLFKESRAGKKLFKTCNKNLYLLRNSHQHCQILEKDFRNSKSLELKRDYTQCLTNSYAYIVKLDELGLEKTSQLQDLYRDLFALEPQPKRLSEIDQLLRDMNCNFLPFK